MVVVAICDDFWILKMYAMYVCNILKERKKELYISFAIFTTRIANLRLELRRSKVLYF